MCSTDNQTLYTLGQAILSRLSSSQKSVLQCMEPLIKDPLRRGQLL